MVVLANPSPDNIFLHKSSKPCASFSDVPVVDLTGPTAGSDIVTACNQFGFFKVTNHGVSKSLVARAEAAAMDFFALPQWEKEQVCMAKPYGYGNKQIGCNGDVGWLEYLLLEVPNLFGCSSTLKEYVSEMKNLASGMLVLMADGLGLEQRNAFSKYIDDERSDSFFRLNHYPPCPMLQGFNNNLNGFGEHTDPQIISVLRSNNSDGLQICLKDGSWVSVAPDQDSFFVNVGDSLQVLTNGRFQSVRHRVVTSGKRSRLSMIYFGGPPLSARIGPLLKLLGEEERSRYRDFTWAEYKTAAFNSRLADDRCEDEHAFELVVASVRIPDLRSRTGASGIGRRSFERCGAKNIRTGKEKSWVPANQA
ncbi:gibberellin 2-beta-dioxygenase-like [Phalaenopsis equestris]|uniref:gibberellin 2-beta-dioxygenase-like n=1 Tax=Phalaenopsis equestris TaxID=78828 RepID=UPI0009E27582|nr:gibberellin 2-beta-dioxygenase-like [Phalaenopsis equestris]